MPMIARVLLTVIVAGALAAPASAAPKVNPKSPAETSAYWTTAKLKAAKPRERVKPGAERGRAPADWTRFTVPLTKGAYTGENRKNGKVFFTLDKVNYVCSGTAVASTTAGVNLVWTAGHCVTDGPGHEATNFMFVPGYINGLEPNGRWAASVTDSTPTWEGQGVNEFRADVGAARVVNTSNASATFASTIGTRPIAFGQNPTTARLVSYGYPAAKPFNGSQQYACASPFHRWDTVSFLDPMQIGCDMTGGSSGGGWFRDVNGNSVADAGEPLVSVNSYGYAFEKTTMYGPYLPAGGEAQTLYDSLR